MHTFFYASEDTHRTFNPILEREAIRGFDEAKLTILDSWIFITTRGRMLL
jgi:hypothetical protein